MRNLSAKKSGRGGAGGAWRQLALAVAITLFAATPLPAAPTKEASNEQQGKQAQQANQENEQARSDQEMEERTTANFDKPLAPSEQPSPAEIKDIEAAEAAEAIEASTGASTKVIHVAQGQVKNSANDPQRSGKCTKYGSWYGVPCADWCDMFVSWVFNRAGYLEAIGGKYDNVDNHIRWFKNHKRFRTKPCKGCVIFLDWNHNGAPNHVGIVMSIRNGYVYTIEGNRSGGSRHVAKVTQAHYRPSDSVVLGYGDPDWKACPSGSVYTCCHCGGGNCGCRPRNMSPANYCGC